MNSAPAVPASVRRVLTIAAFANFTSSLFMRAIDPLVPQVAIDLSTDPANVALLTTAFALPYARLQPVLGPLADMVGKTRLMTICVALLVINAFAGAAAPNFGFLFATRLATGAAAGGIFPIALALAGDLVPVQQRQVAVSRLLAAGMMGNLLGTPGAGLVGDLLGWRAFLAFIGVLCTAALIISAIGFRHIETRRSGLDLATAAKGYSAIFHNPLAKFCFGAVFIEGVFLMGLFPYVALLQRETGGDTRAAIAGLIIAGFALGGVVYSLTVSRLLTSFGEQGLMRGGAALMACGLLAVSLRLSWPYEAMIFMALGCGFYMMHGVIQIYATDLAPAARGSAAAVHSGFFCLGMAIGPIYFGHGLASAGLAATVALSAVVIFSTGLVCAIKLRRSVARKG
ncbi:MAG: MFS transporter [Xanthobacteraceae bacterium]|nr:MFS transporter [Xanthobacteraceae bacterium]